MTVFEIGTAYVGAGESSSWFIHGFNENQWVGFSIVVFPAGCVDIRDGQAVLTQGASSEHVDGTKAYTVKIQNTGIDCIGARILAQVDSL